MSNWSKFKKFLLIFLFILSTLFIAYLIWYLMFAPQESESPESQPLEDFGGLGPAGEGSGQVSTTTGPGFLEPSTDISRPGFQIEQEPVIPGKTEASDTAIGGLTKAKLITPYPVVSPTITQSGDLRFYNPQDGLFYKLDQNGNLIKLSERVFHYVKDATWSSNGQKAIIEYPDGAKINYDFLSEKQITLPKHWEDFSFSPDAKQIVTKSMAYDPENRHLIVANDDGSKAFSLSNIGNNDDSVYPIWSPARQIAAMYTKGVDFNRQEVFFLGLNQENFKSTIIDGRGFEPLWSESGDRLLYSVYNSNNNYNPKLWIVDAKVDSIGQRRINLELNTWASKCSFASNDFIYCAVPQYLPEGSGLFPELSYEIPDDIYRIDLRTGVKKLIASPENEISIESIFVSPTEERLYFTGNYNGRLYEIDL